MKNPMLVQPTLRWAKKRAIEEWIPFQSDTDDRKYIDRPLYPSRNRAGDFLVKILPARIEMHGIEMPTVPLIEVPARHRKMLEEERPPLQRRSSIRILEKRYARSFQITKIPTRYPPKSRVRKQKIYRNECSNFLRILCLPFLLEFF